VSGPDVSVENLPAERAIAIVDIDGVVADVRHRLHHITGRPKDWDAFFAEAHADPPHGEGLRIVHTLAADHEVVYVTGRPRASAEGYPGLAPPPRYR